MVKHSDRAVAEEGGHGESLTVELISGDTGRVKRRQVTYEGMMLEEEDAKEIDRLRKLME